MSRALSELHRQLVQMRMRAYVDARERASSGEPAARSRAASALRELRTQFRTSAAALEASGNYSRAVVTPRQVLADHARDAIKRTSASEATRSRADQAARRLGAKRRGGTAETRAAANFERLKKEAKAAHGPPLGGVKTGKRGGKYVVTKSGAKVYVKG